MNVSVRKKLVASLQHALGDVIATGDSIAERHKSDCSGHAPCRPLALARPATTQDVSAVLCICHEQRCPVVPQGGLTGLAGGAVPTAGDVALCLDRLVGEPSMDNAAGTLTVKAGTTLERVQQMAEEADFRYPIDFSARGSCQIGGTIATNAGGQGVIRHGMTRDQILGLEVVLADGCVLDLMNTMKKNNAGYDLKHCFIGSEGTLGVITRAILQLRPVLGETQTLLCALQDYPSAVALLRRLGRSGLCLEAFEVMWQDFYAMSCGWRDGAPPLPTHYPLYVLCDIEADRERVFTTIEASLAAGEIVDAAVADSVAQTRDLWAIREATAEFPTRFVPINFDVSLPIGAIGDFVLAAKNVLSERWPKCAIVNFGHIGDGNLHLTVDAKPLAPDNGDGRLAIEQVVYELVGRWRGSISAEHGIGLIKRDFLHNSATVEALTLMRALKRTMDPDNILNPGKILRM